MRQILALLFAATLLSGCSGEDAGDDGLPTGDPDGTLGNVTAPDPLHFEADVVVGADPFNFLPTDPNDPASLVGPGPCSQQPAGQDVSCDFYEFTTNGTFDLKATLAWGLTSNDLDLYLYQGTTQTSNDGINNLDPTVPTSLVPVTSQVMDVAALAPGTYTFWVVLWNVAADSYTLDVAFTA